MLNRLDLTDFIAPFQLCDLLHVFLIAAKAHLLGIYDMGIIAFSLQS